ncbi:hypothetical protein GOBAR_AA17946 [Gossypium barbadense]|uniref:Uncharacterized protein n=1 Tax=Gossypium barbadense TaxID=3634 RepID=A0A2P5XH81_GOSBA|nr:hypothetical protein GOBAR_AA17946 [Gossypium barbadense]
MENLLFESSVNSLSSTYLSIEWSWWFEEFILLIPAIILIKIMFQTGVVYLKSAELGMTYLDYTEWENAKYRKRDSFIRCGSDNLRIYGI